MTDLSEKLLTNKSFLEEYFLNNLEIALSAFDMFKTEMEKEIIQLDNLFDKEKYIEYRTLLHKWKPNFKIFGLDEIYNKVGEYEQFIKNNKSIITKNQHTSLNEVIKRGISELELFFETE